MLSSDISLYVGTETALAAKDDPFEVDTLDELDTCPVEGFNGPRKALPDNGRVDGPGSLDSIEALIVLVLVDGTGALEEKISVEGDEIFVVATE